MEQKTTPLTVGQLRKAIAGLPDEAVVVLAEDDLGIWARELLQAMPCRLDQDEKGEVQVVALRKKAGKRTNGLILFWR